MTRRILSTRQVDRLLAESADAAFVLSRPLPADDGVLEAGQDVTERVRDWPPGVLRTHVKRGYVAVIRRPPGNAALAALARTNVGTRRDALRAALEAAGVNVPQGTNKAEMLLLRATALAGAA